MCILEVKSLQQLELVIITSTDRQENTIQKLLQHQDQKGFLLFVWLNLVKISVKCYFIKFTGSCYTVSALIITHISWNCLPRLKRLTVWANYRDELFIGPHSKYITVITRFSFCPFLRRLSLFTFADFPSSHPQTHLYFYNRVHSWV